MALSRVLFYIFVAIIGLANVFCQPAWADRTTNLFRLDIEDEDPDKFPFVKVDKYMVLDECQKKAEQYDEQQRPLPTNVWLRKVNMCLKEVILQKADILYGLRDAPEFKDRIESLYNGIIKVMDVLHNEHSHCPCGATADLKSTERVNKIFTDILLNMIDTINQYQYSEYFPSPRYKKWKMDIHLGTGMYPETSP